MIETLTTTTTTTTTPQTPPVSPATTLASSASKMTAYLKSTSSCASTSTPTTHLDAVTDLYTRNISNSDVSTCSEELLLDFNESLLQNSPITMLPNYNINPTGEEFGDYLVIDVGGSTLRVAVISIDPGLSPQSSASSSPDTTQPSYLAGEDRSNRVHIVIEKKWEIENSFKNIDGNFFKWIGSKIHETLSQQHVIPLNTDVIKTGITWSFPLETTSHNNGKINYVGKGYTIADDIYDRDLKEIIETATKTHFNLIIDVRTVINDSLAVYAAGRFLDKYTRLAMVLGTGLNLCVALNAHDLHPKKQIKDESIVLLNTETSLFGRTFLNHNANKYDAKIDPRFKYNHHDLSFKPHMETDPVDQTIFQPIELMTSGRYLPELTRLIVEDLIEKKEIFSNGDFDFSQWHEVYTGFTGELMCYISENDDVQGIKSKIGQVYNWDAKFITIDDVKNLKIVINNILKRAAFIVASVIITYIKLINLHNSEVFNSRSRSKKIFKIGFVGSVLLYFNTYRDLILLYVNHNDFIADLNLKVDFKSVDNSSIVGAAIGAAYYKDR